MPLECHQIDAFTDQPFKGNPAAVVYIPNNTWPPDSLLTNIAKEMNLSETAFIKKRHNPTPENEYDLRWFTPACEVNLCGHATLAAAHFLNTTSRWDTQNPVHFHTKSGTLIATFNNTPTPQYQLDFPADHPEPVDPQTAQQVLDTLPTPPEISSESKPHHPNVFKGKDDFMVVYNNPAAVFNAQPDLPAIKKLHARGVIVTALYNHSNSTENENIPNNIDFISRFFGPAAGIDEDPVTGSAHCLLAPYYQSILNKNTFNAYQASPRGGHLAITLQNNRALLSGQAVTTLIGQILTDPNNQ